MNAPRSEAETRYARQVGQNIRRHRKSLGLTAKDLADLVCGVPMSEQGVSKIERGYTVTDRRTAVTVDQLVAFAAALGVTPGDLLSEPKCDKCMGAPPRGFACRECGAEA